jgi:alpha-tubulin suppressor-like RCC1 family protein
MKITPRLDRLQSFLRRPAIAAVLLLQLASISSVSAQISTGGNHTLAVDPDTGTVMSWGLNTNGQLGDGTTTLRDEAVSVLTTSGPLTGITAVSAGGTHSVALATDGTVWSWGYNLYGQLGNGNNTQQTKAVQVLTSSGPLTDVVAIAAGEQFTLALKSDGTVWSWGYNNVGQLGNGGTANQNRAAPTGLSGVTSIAAGQLHALARKNDGTVWSWGYNLNGQLGDNTTANRTSAVQVVTASGPLTGVARVAAGNVHSLALKTDGTVCAWGYNLYGAIGDNTTTHRLVATPTLGLTDVVAIDGGLYHSLALKSDGTAWSWGYNFNGQLGDGTLANRHQPVQVAGLTNIRTISARGNRSMAMLSDGRIYGVGDNTYGAFGSGEVGHGSTPAAVPGLESLKAVSAGLFSSLALEDDGTLWAFGQNIYGQLGINSVANTNIPAVTTILSNVASFSAGSYHAAAVKTDGTAWAWGYNTSGQVGDGTTTQRNQPVQALDAAGPLTGIVSVAAGGTHTAGLKNDGTVWTWGGNSDGQLGDGTTTKRTKAVQVLTAGGPLTGIVGITAGSYHTVAVKNDGTVWAWGRNTTGQLGNGSTLAQSYAIQVPLAGSAIAVAAGDGHTLALMSDHSLMAWGGNAFGQLGDNSTTHRYSPVAIGLISGVASVSAHQNHTMAVKLDRTVWGWGSNSFGEIGNASFANARTPQQITGLTAADEAIVANAGDCGGYHSLLINADLTLSAWGSNLYGQLGDGLFGYSTTPVQATYVNHTDTSGIWVDQNAPAGGNGTFAAPYQTIAAAIAQSKKVTDTNTRITVRAGVYHESVILNGTYFGAKSGTPGNPFVLRGMPGERVVISGFKPITGWTLDSGNVYVADIGTWNPASPTPPNKFPETFYVGRSERLMAQSPDVGTGIWTWQSKTTVVEDPEADPVITNTIITDTAHLVGVGDLVGGYVQYFNGDSNVGGVILENDPVAGTLKFAGSVTTGPNAPYIIKNRRQLVNEPGEWACIAQPDGTYQVYYWPHDVAELADTQSRNGYNYGISLYGLHDIEVSGFEVEGISGQGNGISAVNCDNVAILRNVVHDNGGYFWQNGRVGAIYGPGISLRNVHGDSRVANNHVTLNNFGIVLTQCSDVVVTRNEIAYNNIDGMDLSSNKNLSTPCINITISENYIHHHFNLIQHSDNIQTYETGVQNLNLLDNALLGSPQIMINGLGGGTFAGNVVTHSNINNLAGPDAELHYYDNPVVTHNNTFATGLALRESMENSSFENVVYGRLTTRRPQYTGDRNFLQPVPLTATTYDPAQIISISPTNVWSAYGWGNTGVAGFYSLTGQDQNSVIGDRFTSPFVNLPSSVRYIADPTKGSFTATSSTVCLYSSTGPALADFKIGDHVEFNMDGVVRTVTAIDTTNNLVTFTPALYARTPGDGRGWASLGRNDFLENWGSRTDFTRDSRLITGSPARTMSSTGGPVGSLINLADYQASDFDGDGVRDNPPLPADVKANQGEHDFHLSPWLSYGN